MRIGWLALGILLLACGRQGQGERCQLLNGDADCESGLVCTPARDLRAQDEVDRCCPSPQAGFTDPRCDRSGTRPTPSGGTGGMAGASGSPQMSGGAGTSGGTAGSSNLGGTGAAAGGSAGLGGMAGAAAAAGTAGGN